MIITEIFQEHTPKEYWELSEKWLEDMNHIFIELHTTKDKDKTPEQKAVLLAIRKSCSAIGDFRYSLIKKL